MPGVLWVLGVVSGRAAFPTSGRADRRVRDQDVVFGYYDIKSRQFHTPAGPPMTPPLDLSNPSHVTGAQVTVVMDDSVNANSPAFLSVLLGRDGFDVTNQAIAYRGFVGSFDPGDFDLPVAIDSCKLVSDPDGCGTDYCETIESPPNPCPLTDPQTVDDGPVTCLEFSSTPQQNACWTAFNGTSPSVNNPDLGDIIDNGNPNDTEAGDEVYLDNGDKSPSVRRIREKFYGVGAYAGNPHGEDRYAPFQAPPKSDSWVVKLPVVECQSSTHCAGGSPAKIIGGVCFQIREVHAPPYESDRVIKGRFLCPTDPDPDVQALWQDYCADEADEHESPSGCDFGFFAEKIVLVE